MEIYLSTLVAHSNTDEMADILNSLTENVGIEFFNFELDGNAAKGVLALHEMFKERKTTFHAPMAGTEGTAEKGGADYYRLIENYKKAAALAAKTGSKTIVFHTNECVVTKENKAELQSRLLSNLFEIVEICKGYNLRVLAENLGTPGKGLPLFDSKEYAELILNNKDISAIIDIGHLNINKWDIKWLAKKLGGRIDSYHIHNNNGISDSHSGISCGTFDYGNFFEIYKKYTKNAKLVLEYEKTEFKGKESLKNDLKAIKGYLGEL